MPIFLFSRVRQAEAPAYVCSLYFWFIPGVTGATIDIRHMLVFECLN